MTDDDPTQQPPPRGKLEVIDKEPLYVLQERFRVQRASHLDDGQWKRFLDLGERYRRGEDEAAVLAGLEAEDSELFQPLLLSYAMAVGWA